MSDVGFGKDGGGAIFRPATIALMIVIGVVGFFGALTLGAYAPDLEGEGGPGTHALSNAAIGFSGLVQLASGTGRNPKILRDEQIWQSEDLVVATPERAATNLNKIIAARGTTKPTLYVLPKWDAAEDRDHKGWVRIKGLLPAFEPEGVLAPGLMFEIKRHMDKKPALHVADPNLPASLRFVTPAKLQVMERPSRKAKANIAAPVKVAAAPPGEDAGNDRAAAFDHSFDSIRPVITDGAGGIVLGEIDNMYVLADPDLIDNAAMKHSANAASALALLDWLNGPNAQGVGFDVVLNGLGEGKSLLRLAFDPPFLAMTLTLAAMALLLGIRAAGRFGAPRLRARAIAFGKAALVDNGALLVSKARKARLLGGSYAEVIREQAVRAFGVSPRFSPAEVDSYLDGLGQGARFTELARRAEAADSENDMLAAARALHAWKREVVRDD
jgi:hypothetical protein